MLAKAVDLAPVCLVRHMPAALRPMTKLYSKAWISTPKLVAILLKKPLWPHLIKYNNMSGIRLKKSISPQPDYEHLVLLRLTLL